MNYDDVSKFQKEQERAVAKIGAFLTCLDSFIEKLNENGHDSIAEIRKMQPVVGEFIESSGRLHGFLKKYHYAAYYKPIGSSANKISVLLANQTMPSLKKTDEQFVIDLSAVKQTLSEAMIAIAQIVSSPVDANLIAGNSFSAYCFLHSLINTTKDELIIVDPYLDKTIFIRYLSELDKGVKITVVSDSRKLKGNKLTEFEMVEDLFKKEFPFYTRKMFNDLHDRYLINEVAAYNLGGSIAHAGFKSDFSVVELSSEKRSELIKKYA